jgi:hypothetical protein
MQREFCIYYDKQHTAVLLIFLNIPHMFLLKNETKDWCAQLIHVKFGNSVWLICGDVNSWSFMW